MTILTRLAIPLLFLVALGACSSGDSRPVVNTASAVAPPAAASQPTAPQRLQSWRVVLVAGDDSEAVFDNAVDAFTEQLSARPGVDVRRLTSDSALESGDRGLATAQTIDDALSGNQAQGCFVFMTSHGIVDGLLLREDIDNGKILSPGRLDRILDRQCGQRPTVVVASACHSGVFITSASQGANRVLLTAARDDLVSFGCGANFEFTYFDECMLRSWPESRTWRQLFDRTNTCVRFKESELSQAASMPQSYFGANVRDLELP
jgi:Peptidase C13 family